MQSIDERLHAMPVLVNFKNMLPVTAIIALADFGKNVALRDENAAGYADMAADLAPLMTRYGLAKYMGTYDLSASIIEIAIELVAVLQQLNGFGDPDTGDAFDAGMSRLFQIHDDLGPAFPSGGWQGNAARAYAAKNLGQQDLLGNIAEGDKIMSRVLKAQAHDVTLLRNGLAGIRAVLAAAYVFMIIFICWANLRPVYERHPLVAYAKAYQIRVSSGALGAALGLITWLMVRTDSRADDVDKAIKLYDKAGFGLGLPVLTVEAPGLLATSGSSVSSFSEISRSMSGAPTASGSASAVRYAGDQPIYDPDASRIDPHFPGRDSDKHRIDPILPDIFGATESPAAPTVAASGVPASGRPVQMSGQAANVSGEPSKRLNQAAVPAAQGAAAEEVEDVETGAGTGAGERAPITAATRGDTRAQEPSPVQRNP
jgi:hypothetical protein